MKPFDVDAVKLLVDNTEASVPSKSYDPISEKTLTGADLKEGESYLHVMFHNATGWGAPAHRKIRIDMTPPKSFAVTASQDSQQSYDITLNFGTEDDMSGVARYEIFLDGTSVESITKDKIASDGSYTVTVPGPGEHVFTVTAYDAAENSAKAET